MTQHVQDRSGFNFSFVNGIMFNHHNKITTVKLNSFHEREHAALIQKRDKHFPRNHKSTKLKKNLDIHEGKYLIKYLGKHSRLRIAPRAHSQKLLLLSNYQKQIAVFNSSHFIWQQTAADKLIGLPLSLGHNDVNRKNTHTIAKTQQNRYRTDVASHTIIQ